MADGESTRTVVIAGLANLAIAAAKAIGGVISGSSAMLSEAAHSLADTTTEVLLFVAIRRGARPPDARYGLGHGRAAFLWALLAAGFMFVAGGGFAITQGVHTIARGGTNDTVGDAAPSFIILAVSFGLETVSLVQGVRQARGAAARYGVSMARYLRNTSDTAVKAVVLEDIAALTGIVLAAAGLGLAALTGSAVWDGIASILIGVLLIAVAASLVRSNASLLAGRSVPASLEERMRAELLAVAPITAVHRLFTTVIGMGEVLVAAHVGFAAGATADEIVAAADEAERRLLSRFPGVRYVFLDPTGRS